MGFLHYDGARFELEDRLLAHLQTVMTIKLRRSESFFLSWTASVAEGSGRQALWISPGVPIRLECRGNRLSGLNREWIEKLTSAANSSGGLVITEEGDIHPE